MSYREKLYTYFTNLHLVIESLRKAGLEKEDINMIITLRHREAEFLGVGKRIYIPNFYLKNELIDFLER